MRLHCLTVVFALPLSLAAQEAKAALNARDVEGLIRNLPDKTLAIEIREHGIKPLLTYREFRRFHDMRVGPETESALAQFVQPSVLTIITEPPIEGLSVTVDGHTVATNASGEAVITGLTPGSYSLTTEQPPAYPRSERYILLSEGGSRERVMLRPAPARLNVPVNNAQIEIATRGTYSGPLRDLELPAGTYRISLKSPEYLPYSTSLTVGPGEVKTIEPSLTLDPVAFASELKGLLERGDVNAFRSKATLALDGRVDPIVAIKLLHHHPGGFHEANVTVQRSGLLFEPLAQCTWKAGLIPFDRVREVVVLHDGSSGVLLRIAVGSGKSQGQLNFAVLGSWIGQETETKPLKVGAVTLGTNTSTHDRVQSPSSAEGVISALSWLIMSLLHQ